MPETEFRVVNIFAASGIDVKLMKPTVRQTFVDFIVIPVKRTARPPAKPRLSLPMDGRDSMQTADFNIGLTFRICSHITSILSPDIFRR